MTHHTLVNCSTVREILAGFETIGLEEMDHVRLMNRTDTKYLLTLEQFLLWLPRLSADYRILEVQGERLNGYQTYYFDTPELDLYHDHRRGRLNRYKIRLRKYMTSGVGFLEVKFKNNKGRTIKNRVPSQLKDLHLQNRAEGQFVKEETPYHPANLQGVLWVEYDRVTLVSRRSQERLTLDLNLSFSSQANHQEYHQLVIAEVKQDTNQNSPFVRLMKQQKIRPGGLSKYCLGMISLYQPISFNRFKLKLRILKKLIAS